MEVWRVLANILSPEENVKMSNVMTESSSCEEEESEDDDSSWDTLVEIEIDDNAASKVAGSSLSKSQDKLNTGTTQGSLSSDKDPIAAVGDLDDGRLGSSDSNLYYSTSSVGNSNEESSNTEENNDESTKENNESTSDNNESPTAQLTEEDNVSTADGNGRLESSTNEVEDAPEDHIRRSTTRIRTHGGC
jgi:hypothetical protein